jgi:NAD(P)H-dependent FMN reductase/ketosteroid isomerase-like protein
MPLETPLGQPKENGPRRRVAVLVGSLRSASLSRKIANALIDRAPQALECHVVEIGDVPLYNEDTEAQPPDAWGRLRREIRAAEAVLFVTPEYNRSLPGSLKNAIDVGSRPANQSVWAGKPAGVVSVTPYKLGAFGANHALRQTFVFLDMPVMQQPEAYIGGAAELFDDAGALKSAETDKFLRVFMKRFAAWIETSRAAGPPAFDEFLQERKEAAETYVQGDAAPLDRLLAQDDPATFFHPRGDVVTRAQAVKARYDEDAKIFSPGGDSTLEILQSAASGGLAFWSGLQRAHAVLHGKPVPMTLRITEVFRLEAGQWKLVHRHADDAHADGKGGAD